MYKERIAKSGLNYGFVTSMPDGVVLQDDIVNVLMD